MTMDNVNGNGIERAVVANGQRREYATLLTGDEDGPSLTFVMRSRLAAALK
jgi:hypothetical protein